MTDALSESLDPACAPAIATENAGYTVEIVNDVAVRWDALVAGFADVALEQTASYMAPRWGHAHLSGLVLRGAMSGEPEAAALAVIAVLPVLKAGLAYVKFGPLWVVSQFEFSAAAFL